jgi:hypothetical protein
MPRFSHQLSWAGAHAVEVARVRSGRSTSRAGSVSSARMTEIAAVAGRTAYREHGASLRELRGRLPLHASGLYTEHEEHVDKPSARARSAAASRAWRGERRNRRGSGPARHANGGCAAALRDARLPLERLRRIRLQKDDDETQRQGLSLRKRADSRPPALLASVLARQRVPDDTCSRGAQG